MPNICMVVHNYYYHDPRVRRYTEALVEAGVHVDIVCLHALGKSLRSEDGSLRVFTIPFSRGGSRRMGYLTEYVVSFILYTVWLLALYTRNRYAVIHVHNMPDFLIFVALIPRLLGAKIILDIHDPTPEFYMSKHTMGHGSPVVTALRVQERLSALLAHNVITANTSFKANLTQRGIPASKISVINNIPDPRIFDRTCYSCIGPTNLKNFTLLYTGTIASRYGLHTAIRALPILVDKIPHLRLEIIGVGEQYVDELNALIDELNVSAHVEILPAIPLTEVPRKMVLADVGIYPALPDPHMDIAVPSKVLEYVAMGLPVLSSRLKALENLFDDSAIVFVRPGDVNDFARGALELFEDPAHCEELARNATEQLQTRHSWANERQVYFTLMNELLEAGEKLANYQGVGYI